ncbi:MAG: alpha/beta hydrolase-fold protein [Tunicatimonas sp.]
MTWISKGGAILLIGVACTVSAKAQIDTVSLSFGSKTFVSSDILGENVEAWIRVPSDFEELKDSCSLLILLDGDEYFKMASDVAELYEWAGKMPPTVIVGLPSTVESRWKYYTPTREKAPNSEDSLLFSLTGNFDKFADFLSKEFMPELSQFLDVKFISKTVFGHSNGGIAVMSFYTIRPDIFDNYIAASPAILWDDYYLQQQISLETRREPVYMTLGTNGWDYKVKSFKTIKKRLSSTNKWFKFVTNDTDSHAINGLRTLLDGLKYVYASSAE